MMATAAACHRFALVAALVTAVACTDAPAPPAASAAAPMADKVELDPRDQYALLDAIVAAKGATIKGDVAALASLRAAWTDRRYRWEARIVPTLCSDAGDCVVMPFDHNARAEPVVEGWLPRLDLSAAARSDLRQRCRPHRACVIRFSGTLSQFELSTELPTSLTFSDVAIETTRNAAPGESWAVSKRRNRLAQRIAAAQAAARTAAAPR